jgi:hypothetical protein
VRFGGNMKRLLAPASFDRLASVFVSNTNLGLKIAFIRLSIVVIARVEKRRINFLTEKSPIQVDRVTMLIDQKYWIIEIDGPLYLFS